MSDFYDSLEDESDENKRKSGSPEEPETADIAEVVTESESPVKFSFFLKEKPSEEEQNPEENETLVNDEQEKHFLPKIENNVTEKGVEVVRDADLENQMLNKQGLQLNNDGSITKSPRKETEELPFITREYRNLQFQKRKTFASKSSLSGNNQSKNSIKETEKQADGISLKMANSAKWKKGSNEKLITRNSSFTSSTSSRAIKQFGSNYNMTDSMKEKLLQNQKENIRSSLTTIGSIKKSGCDMSLSKTPEVLRQNKFSDETLGDQKKTFRFVHRLQKNQSCLDSSQKQFKAGHQRIHGYPSDISLTTLRPKLNYLDKHQLENGFKVFHLKQFDKKVESDSNRSNFGDSVMDELPEVQTLPSSCANTGREDEELFYRQLIEKDKFLKEQSHHSARSEGPIDKIKRNIGSNSYKSQTKILEERQNFLRLKNLKSMNIDLPNETHIVTNPTKRWSHFCTDDSSKNATKIELALKGKTYGHLANARNIFRLKAQSERKLVKEENSNINPNIQPIKKNSDSSQGVKKATKRSSPPIGIFPNVKGGVPRYLDKSPRGSKSCSKTKVTEIFWDTQKDFVLPQVLNQRNSNTKNTKE